jgi:hypothetical protein
MRIDRVGRTGERLSVTALLSSLNTPLEIFGGAAPTGVASAVARPLEAAGKPGRGAERIGRVTSGDSYRRFKREGYRLLT